jgi:hypothetical protein
MVEILPHGSSVDIGARAMHCAFTEVAHAVGG